MARSQGTSDNKVSVMGPLIVLYAIIPPVIFFGMYFVTGTMLLIICLGDAPLALILLAVALVALAVGILPLWYKTFFDRLSIGLDRLVSIEWDERTVQFRGIYFDLSIPVSDVLHCAYRAADRSPSLTLRIRTPKGKVETLTMRHATRGLWHFVVYLASQGVLLKRIE